MYLRQAGDCGGAFAATDDRRETGKANGAIDRGNDQIELRSLVRTGQDHPDWMEQILALEAGAILDAIRGGTKRVLVGQARQGGELLRQSLHERRIKRLGRRLE